MNSQAIKMSGHAVIGECKGVKIGQFTNRTTGEIINTYQLGISTLLPDGYGGHKEEITDIALSKSLVASGAPSKLAAYIGKTIICPVWHSAFAMSGGQSAGFRTYLTNDWEQTIFVVPDQPLQKVS
jgi:hypothetical protein